MAGKNKKTGKKTESGKVAVNRKARHEYSILDTMEAGLVLQGTEVKSLREGRANLNDAFAGENHGEIFLFNAYIPEYNSASRFNHETRRPRKLLLQGKQVSKLIGQVKTKGMTLVPLSIYFNKRGYAKVELALAQGKRDYEKRDSIKEREWKQDQERAMKNKW